MCWAIPLKIIEINGDLGKVELEGTVREVGLQLLDDPKPGEYVLVHAGFAIQKLDEQEAQETLRIWEELAQSMADEKQRLAERDAAGPGAAT